MTCEDQYRQILDQRLQEETVFAHLLFLDLVCADVAHHQGRATRHGNELAMQPTRLSAFPGQREFFLQSLPTCCCGTQFFQHNRHMQKRRSGIRCRREPARLPGLPVGISQSESAVGAQAHHGDGVAPLFEHRLELAPLAR